ncbi:TonB-dependent receptor plug domain-containing protein, partial [Burkholderia cenocepacia]|nr:TonB-dependent receptor plug domain-containing protein [Burkholderia cenocepacia]
MLEVSSVEVHRERIAINIDQEVQERHITVKAKGTIGIEEVEIKGRTKKKDLETSGFAVAVIETKEASLRNLTTNELLDRAVGVRVRQNGGVGSQVEYNLNGMSGSTVGLFLDGIEVSTYGQSFN